MSRISSQGTVIKVQTAADPTPFGIISVSKAKPCVIGCSVSAPPVDGIVVPKGTGFASIDGRPFKVAAVNALNVTLEDSDTSKEKSVAVIGPGTTLNEPVMTELCRSTFTINNPAGATIDVTTLCDSAHQIVSGLPAIGTWQSNGFYDYADAAMWAVRDYYRSGEIVAWQVTFRDGSGLLFNGNCNLFDITTGINAAVANNISGQISGLVSSFAP
jgi:hypothetical protein